MLWNQMEVAYVPSRNKGKEKCEKRKFQTFQMLLLSPLIDNINRKYRVKVTMNYLAENYFYKKKYESKCNKVETTNSRRDRIDYFFK